MLSLRYYRYHEPEAAWLYGQHSGKKIGRVTQQQLGCPLCVVSKGNSMAVAESAPDLNNIF